jgi:hypothetical protein
VLAAQLSAVVQRKIATGRPYTPADWQRQSLFQKLRGGVVRLGQPYL